LRLVVLTTVLLLLVPAAAPAANIFVWNYDTLDRFVDPQLMDSIDCAYWVTDGLTAQGHTVAISTELPSSLTDYDAVFCLMGFFRC
jgi:hypothetical protein